MKKPKWELVYYKSFFRWIPFIRRTKLQWKDKWGTPRCEWPPKIRIEWLWFAFHFIQGQEDDYWEQWLREHNWHFGDEVKAKESWHWVN